MSGLGILSTSEPVSVGSFPLLDAGYADPVIAVLLREATFNWQTETFSKLRALPYIAYFSIISIISP
jgi:hypothetical protein